MDEQLAHVLADEGVIDIRLYRHLRDRVRRAVQRGELVRVLQGIYAPDFSLSSRVLALQQWDPDAIVTGATAAKATWWPDHPTDTVHASSRRHMRSAPPGFEVRRRDIPEELVIERSGIRYAAPPLAVLQMIPTDGASAIDEALRRRTVRVGDLIGALRLIPGRDGNKEAARLLIESRDEPWSYLERQGHQLLREAGIGGWKSNYLINLADEVIFADVAWPGLKLIVEFDGWEFHRDYTQFVADRRRDAELIRRGWTVLRFTAASMDTLIDIVKAVTARLRRD